MSYGGRSEGLQVFYKQSRYTKNSGFHLITVVKVSVQ